MLHRAMHAFYVNIPSDPQHRAARLCLERTSPRFVEIPYLGGTAQSLHREGWRFSLLLWHLQLNDLGQ